MSASIKRMNELSDEIKQLKAKIAEANKILDGIPELPSWLDHDFDGIREDMNSLRKCLSQEDKVKT